jgi:hypothetical protein
MSATADRAAALAAEAERLLEIDVLEQEMHSAKKNYQRNRNNADAKERHRAASQALAEARESHRENPVAVASGAGSATVMPNASRGTSRAAGQGEES